MQTDPSNTTDKKQENQPAETVNKTDNTQQTTVQNTVQNTTQPTTVQNVQPVAPRKKPGRPRKKIDATPIEVHGIVPRPVNDDDIIELVYCNPGLFRKLLQMYKHFEVSEVEMNFDKSGLKIITKDHLGKSTIYTTIDGRCMNLYYCARNTRICVKRANLESVLGALSKSHHKVTFMSKEENYRSTLYIVVKNLEYNNENSYEIDVVHKPEMQNFAEFHDDDANYPLKFQFSSKYFKSLIGNTRRLSPVLTIQKVGEEPMQLTYPKNQKVNWTDVYSDPEKINLKSTVKPDEILSVSVTIDYIKPFAKSNIGDDVFIATHSTEKISFTTFMDKKDIGFAAHVKIYTEVIGYGRAAVK